MAAWVGTFGTPGTLSVIGLVVVSLLLAIGFWLRSRLHRLCRELKAVAEFAGRTRISACLEEVLSRATDSLRGLVPFDECVLLLHDGITRELIPVLRPRDEGEDQQRLLSGLSSEEGFAGKAAKTGKPLLVSDVGRSPEAGEFLSALALDARALLIAPMVLEDRFLGEIVFSSRRAGAFNRSHFRLIEIVAAHCAAAVENSLAYARAEQMAMTDPITGMYNYRYFHFRLSDEINRARITKSPLSLIFLDLNDLKRYNDTFGHVVGDEIIKEVASVLKSNVRDGDVAARYGGDEFVVLMPNTPRQDAEKAAERLKALVQRRQFVPYLASGKLEVTVTVGVASYPEEAINESLLVHLADRNMYLSKKRNAYSPG